MPTQKDSFSDQQLGTFQTLVDIVARLRAPGGCPWDREQTHDSLKRHLLEESYEVIEAIDQGDPGILSEELGDLLVQIAFHADIAKEAGGFQLEEVLHKINSKLVRRHPTSSPTGRPKTPARWSRTGSRSRQRNAKKKVSPSRPFREFQPTFQPWPTPS